jgi:23S rRNA (cytosine1962-C5)-methyltransferase
VSDFSPFRNRLAKNHRHLSRWARRSEITCYRLYDRDVPEFPVSVDRYADRIHLQEVDTGWVQTAAEHDAWLDSVVEVTAQTLELPLAAIRLKRRTPAGQKAV